MFVKSYFSLIGFTNNTLPPFFSLNLIITYVNALKSETILITFKMEFSKNNADVISQQTIRVAACAVLCVGVVDLLPLGRPRLWVMFIVVAPLCEGCL